MVHTILMQTETVFLRKTRETPFTSLTSHFKQTENIAVSFLSDRTHNTNEPPSLRNVHKTTLAHVTNFILTYGLFFPILSPTQIKILLKAQLCHYLKKQPTQLMPYV
jgi:hypothetical protein